VYLVFIDGKGDKDMNDQKFNTCVFYDGACSLCSREIKLYKSLLSKESAESGIEWIDISKNKDELKAEGIKYQYAMKLIHIKDSLGVHQVGIDAVFTLWDKIPYYHKLSGFLQKIPVLTPFLAKHRMKLQ